MKTSPRRPPPDTELSILVQVFRLADPDPEHVEGCEERELEALEQWEGPEFCPYFSQEPGPPQTNAWFIITDSGGDEGLQVSEIFGNVGQDRLLHSRKQTNCVVVGSQLYDIGGVGSTLATSLHSSNIIRRLDIENPGIGWKTDTLPFYCAKATATVSGDLIYLFPRAVGFTPVSAHAKEEWAYTYDTVEQKPRPIQLPSSADDFCSANLCFPVDYSSSPNKRGIVTHLSRQGSERFHLLYNDNNHNNPEEEEEGDGDSWKWKSLQDHYAMGLLSHRKQPYAVSSSNGLLYVCDMSRSPGFNMYPGFMYLYVYDITQPRAPLLCTLKLPEFKHFNPLVDDEASLFLIPVSESNICFLWYTELCYGRKTTPIYYAKVKVCIDPPATATLVKQATLELDVVGISSCLPFTMPQGRGFRRFIGPQLRVNETKNPEKKLEGGVEDLKRLIKQLKRRVKGLDRQTRKTYKRIKRIERRLFMEDREERRGCERPHSTKFNTA